MKTIKIVFSYDLDNTEWQYFYYDINKLNLDYKGEFIRINISCKNESHLI